MEWLAICFCWFVAWCSFLFYGLGFDCFGWLLDCYFWVAISFEFGCFAFSLCLDDLFCYLDGFVFLVWLFV